MRDHYRATGLTERLKTALAVLGPDDQRLTPQQLAALDQFHTRGLAATAELAKLAEITADASVLDVGSGVGGPARFLAATYGCRVTGVDLSEPFVDAARYLTERTGQSEQVSFQTASALELPFDDGRFNVVLLQHVAMNISDRARLDGRTRFIGCVTCGLQLLLPIFVMVRGLKIFRASDCDDSLRCKRRQTAVAQGFRMVSAACWHDALRGANAAFLNRDRQKAMHCTGRKVAALDAGIRPRQPIGLLCDDIGRSRAGLQNVTRKSVAKPTLTDAERHKRFAALAQDVGASDDVKDFEKAFKKAFEKAFEKVARRKEANDRGSKDRTA